MPPLTAPYFATLLTISCLPSLLADTLTWNVKKQYGITGKGLNTAIKDARKHFQLAPNDTLVLELDAGRYSLKPTPNQQGIINLSHVKPGPRGRLIIKGQGIDKTVLVFDDSEHAIVGRHTYRVTMSHMHMTREKYTVSQGHVISTAPGKLVLKIQPGFPTPADIFNPDSDQGRYLKRYENSQTDPRIVTRDNEQIAWKSARPLGDSIWEIRLKQRQLVPHYPKGALIGIKSKHGGQTYWFNGGSDFKFDHIKWTHKTRGVFRGAFDKIHIIHCITDRAAPIHGQTPCLASPGGGPQIGQPWDPPTKGNLVKNCRFIASGDDAVAFFHGKGTISDCYIQDAFARGILLANSPDAISENNELVRNPLQRSKDHRLPTSTAPPVSAEKGPPKRR